MKTNLIINIKGYLYLLVNGPELTE